MSDPNYPIRTVWIAPCSECGAEIMTDQYIGSPYFDAGCECGGSPVVAAAHETFTVVW